MRQRSKPATVFKAVASKELYKSSRRFVPVDAGTSVAVTSVELGAGTAGVSASFFTAGVSASFFLGGGAFDFAAPFAGVTVFAVFSTASGDSEE